MSSEPVGESPRSLNREPGYASTLCCSSVNGLSANADSTWAYGRFSRSLEEGESAVSASYRSTMTTTGSPGRTEATAGLQYRQVTRTETTPEAPSAKVPDASVVVLAGAWLPLRPMTAAPATATPR